MRYLTLVSTTINKKIIADNSDNADEKYMKIIFNLDDDVPLNKTLELHNMVVVLRTDYNEDRKVLPQRFLRSMFEHFKIYRIM